MNIFLKRLSRADSGWASGFVFYQGNLYSGVDILNVFKGCYDYGEVASRMSDVSGFFSVVIQDGNNYIIITDRINSIPMYYCKDSIKDTFDLQEQETFFSRESDLIRLYELSGVILEDNTFDSGLKSSGPAEIVIINEYGTSCKSYKVNEFRLENNEPKITNCNHFEKFSNLVSSVSVKLKKVCADRQVIVPLSGGYDSRLVVHMLHIIGVKNVICYTYGNLSDKEVTISKSLADYYGFRWCFIDYSGESIIDSSRSNAFLDFKNKYLSGNSVIHFQDFFAIEYLLKNKLILDASSSVVIPGHALDYLAGNHIPSFCFDTDSVKLDSLIEYIVERHFSLRFRSKKESKLVNDYILKFFNAKYSIEKDDSVTNKIAIELYMSFNFRERQSKLILNSLRVYDYFNLTWFMPLWDDEFFSFFESCEAGLYQSRYIHVNWDHLKIKPTLSEGLQELAYDNSLAKPAKRKTFFKIRYILLKLRVYRLILPIVLLKKVFIINTFNWFGLYSFKTKIKACFLGYKEIYSYLSNREKGVY